MENLLKDKKEHGFEEYTNNLLEQNEISCPKKETDNGCCASKSEGILIQKNN